MVGHENLWFRTDVKRHTLKAKKIFSRSTY